MKDIFVRVGGQWRRATKSETKSDPDPFDHTINVPGESNISWAGSSSASDTGWHDFQYQPATSFNTDKKCRYLVHSSLNIHLRGYIDGIPNTNANFRVDVRFNVTNGLHNQQLVSASSGMSGELSGETWHQITHSANITIPVNSIFDDGHPLGITAELHFIHNTGRMAVKLLNYRARVERWCPEPDLWVKAGGRWHRQAEVKARAGGVWH